MIPYFSIIIPTLNEEKYLPNILSDLASQKLAALSEGEKNFEVIIVDGASTDQTPVVAASFGKKIPVTFLKSQKQNVSYQRNLGAKKAQGEVLVFLDADNRVQPDFLSLLKAAFAKKSGQLFMPYLIPDEKSQKARIMISIVNSVIKASQSYGRPLATGGNFSITKKAFEKVGGFNEKIYISEDHDFVNRAYKIGYKAKILKNLKVVCSMRRGKVEGDIALSYKYVLGFLTYTIMPTDRVLKAKLFEYEMGGHRYEENAEFKMQKSKLEKVKKKINMARVKQLLQLSTIALFLRMFK